MKTAKAQRGNEDALLVDDEGGSNDGDGLVGVLLTPLTLRVKAGAMARPPASYASP